jgi:hypothetical protein
MSNLPQQNNSSPVYDIDRLAAYPTPQSTQKDPRCEQRVRGPPPDFNLSFSRLRGDPASQPPRTIRSLTPDSSHGEGDYHALLSRTAADQVRLFAKYSMFANDDIIGGSGPFVEAAPCCSFRASISQTIQPAFCSNSALSRSWSNASSRSSRFTHASNNPAARHSSAAG